MLGAQRLAIFTLVATLAACTTSDGDGGDGGSTGGTDPNGCRGATGESVDLDDQEVAMLDIINQYRADNGVGPLAACRSLNRAAQGHSEDMRDRDYFEHEAVAPAPFGVDPWSRMCAACYDLACEPVQTAVGENLAAGFDDAANTFEQWRTSPGHNEIMLDPDYTVAGLGRALGGGEYGVYWTNTFGGSDHASCQ